MLFCFVLFFADVYNIVSNRGTVGRFCLFKSAYRIGEEIVGSFDFSESFIMCLKVNMLIGSFRQALAGLSLGLRHLNSLILHIHSKFITLWVNSIDNRQFHLQHQEKINHMKPQQVLQVTDLNDSPVPFMLATKEILFPCCTFQ